MANLPQAAPPPGAAPLQSLTPEQLAQLAQAAFRPPNLPQAPGMSIPQPQQQAGGMGLGQAAGMLGMGMHSLKPRLDGTTPGVPTPAGDPTGGAGPAFLGGTTSLAPQPDSGGFFDWLNRQVKGLF